MPIRTSPVAIRCRIRGLFLMIGCVSASMRLPSWHDFRGFRRAPLSHRLRNTLSRSRFSCDEPVAANRHNGNSATNWRRQHKAPSGSISPRRGARPVSIGTRSLHSTFGQPRGQRDGRPRHGVVSESWDESREGRLPEALSRNVARRRTRICDRKADFAGSGTLVARWRRLPARMKSCRVLLPHPHPAWGVGLLGPARLLVLYPCSGGSQECRLWSLHHKATRQPSRTRVEHQINPSQPGRSPCGVQPTPQLMQEELQKVIVGQGEVIEQIFAAIFTRGHCLLVGRARAGQDVDGQHPGPDPRH